VQKHFPNLHAGLNSKLTDVGNETGNGVLVSNFCDCNMVKYVENSKVHSLLDENFNNVRNRVY
jgi:hypothetical protein